MVNHEAVMANILAAMDQEAPPVKAITAMIYGPSGAGKTVLAAVIGATLNPPGKFTLFVDTSRGYVSLGNHEKLRGTFKTVPYTGLDELETLAIMLEKRHHTMANVGTVVFDEISKMVRNDTDMTAARNHRDGTPEWPDYHESLARTRRVLARIMTRDDINFIMLAHEREKKNKAGTVVMTYPDFIPSVVKELKEDIHLVARMTAAAKAAEFGKEPEYLRIIQAMPSVSIDAKSRLPKMTTQMSSQEFVDAISIWLAAGGNLVPELDTAGDPSPIPEDFRGVNADEPESLGIDDAAPAWSANE